MTTRPVMLEKHPQTNRIVNRNHLQLGSYLTALSLTPLGNSTESAGSSYLKIAFWSTRVFSASRKTTGRKADSYNKGWSYHCLREDNGSGLVRLANLFVIYCCPIASV